MSDLKTVIERAGQPYLDEPVYVQVSQADSLALAVNAAFAQVPGGRPVRGLIEELSHFQRVRLRWLAPDGKGGFVPKSAAAGRAP